MGLFDIARGVVLLAAMTAGPVQAQDAPRVLDAFEDASQWRVIASNQVSGSLRSIAGADGQALCLDYDFNGVSGYVGLQRDLALEYTGNYRFGFKLRGDSPDNDLQFKLIDASGDNVWWVNRPRYDFPREWTQVDYRKRHIDKAWGPDPDKTLRSSAKLEFTIYNNAGGRGAVCFDTLTLEPLDEDDGSALLPVSAISTVPANDAMALFDADPATGWRAPAGPQRIAMDLGRVREFGGLRLQWRDGQHASGYAVSLSKDGEAWQQVRRVVGGNGGVDWLALPESEARYVTLDLEQAADGREYVLSSVEILPLSFSLHPNDPLIAMAKEAPRGWFPRGFSGEQPYWTILGLDGGIQQGLIGEDGAVEVAKGGFSIEPFVHIDGKLITWNDVQVSHSLQDGYLPIPSVRWRRDDLDLQVTAFAHGEAAQSRLVLRYRLTNPGRRARDYTLALALQPFQVNPPRQFLNTPGGVSRISALSFEGATASVDGVPRVFSKQIPDAAFASSFDGGMAVTHLAASAMPATARVEDPTGLASGAMLYRMRLGGWESREIQVMVPMTGNAGLERRWWDADVLQRAVAESWREKLDRVRIDGPAAAQPVADAIRTSLAHMLISRIGPRLQPGTRSYARSWIRDGAMISEGLLRMGREDVVKEYVEWYAPYQFDNGMVPCCVDDRGSDPVPENDSHGELIYNIAEYWRYTGDTAFLERMWPHVLGAFNYMETLRASERTEANRALNPAFYGMMPASISHEGYSAKPMHSYWDNFWALRGYKDAVVLADALGKSDELPRLRAARDQFRDDLMASLLAAVQLHGIDFLPGAAELGDFDPTSTTIALAPGGEQDWLPRELLESTFERYWNEFVARRDGKRTWKDYTPYEWRNVAAMVRLGWRDRAREVFDWFFDDRTPHAWNQWGEVVSRTPREPFFVGDLPHAWVGSDFLRSALEMFAYVRERDTSVVIAAGLPPEWLDEGIGIHGLYTPHGRLGYRVRRDGDVLELGIDGDSGLPPGGVVFPWPYASKPGETTIDGQPADWVDGELRVPHAANRVLVRMERDR